MDLFGVENRVPDVSDVETVYFYGDIGYPYDDGRLRFDNTSDPRLIEMVTRLHREAVEEKGRAQQVGGDDYISFDITYTLKNGGKLSRWYTSVPVYKDELHDQNTVTGCAQLMLEDRALMEQMYNFDSYEQGQLTSASLIDLWNEQDEYFEAVPLEQSAAQLRELWQAVRLDFEEGNIGVHTLFPDPFQSDITPQLDFAWVFETDERDQETADREGSRTIRYEDLTIAITPQSEHTLACLEEMGLPGAGYGLFHTN